MKKLIILLLLPFLGFSQAVFDEGIQLSGNTATAASSKILSQQPDTGDLNYIDAADLPVSEATREALDSLGFLKIPDGANIVDFLIDGKNARITTSNDYSVSGTPKKLAIFFHFYGGNYTTMPSSKLRDSLLNNGYSIASISAGENWGNEKAQQLYFKLYNDIIKKFNVDKQPIAVSASMGTLAALNLINRNLVPFRALVSTIGVVNLSEYYGRAIGFAAGNDIQTAYEFTTAADSTKAFFGFDPYTRLNTSFGDTIYKTPCPIYFINGETDTSTPLRFTERVYEGLNRSYSNSILEVVAGVGHDTSIVTTDIAHRVMLWLKSNPLNTTRILPEEPPVLKASNGFKMIDNTLGDSQLNYIEFLKKDGVRRGLFGYLDASVVGSNGTSWTNQQGSIGIFSKDDSEVSLGTTTILGAISKKFTVNNTYSLSNNSLGVGVIPSEKLHVKGKFRVDRLVGSNYVLIDAEAGAASFLGKNGGSALYSQLIFNQGNNTTDREVGRFDGSGNLLLGTTTGDGSKLKVVGTITGTNYTGGATLTGTPTAPTATAGTNTTQIATTAFVNTAITNAIIPYKRYRAILSQSGTSSPTAVVLENTLGGTVVWTKTLTGVYAGTLTGAFTSNKTICFTTLNAGTAPTSGNPLTSHMGRYTDNAVQVYYAGNGVLQDNFTNMQVEIIVYN